MKLQLHDYGVQVQRMSHDTGSNSYLGPFLMLALYILTYPAHSPAAFQQCSKAFQCWETDIVDNRAKRIRVRQQSTPTDLGVLNVDSMTVEE